MKKLIFVGGSMGVGKTATCRALQRLLPRCVFLDGDWCWDMQPFTVTEETKAMVLRNIHFLLNSFLACSELESVLFCWVMDEQSILDAVLDGLDTQDCLVRVVYLTCTPEALQQRLQQDVAAGLRTQDVIGRSLARLQKIQALAQKKLDTTDLSAEQAAAELARLFSGSSI